MKLNVCMYVCMHACMHAYKYIRIIIEIYIERKTWHRAGVAVTLGCIQLSGGRHCATS